MMHTELSCDAGRKVPLVYAVQESQGQALLAEKEDGSRYVGGAAMLVPALSRGQADLDIG